jgi:hypothetical protein
MLLEKSTLKVELKIHITSKINSVLRKTDELNVNATSGWRISKFNLTPATLFGAFEKLRKATISFVMSVCPSVRLSA